MQAATEDLLSKDNRDSDGEIGLEDTNMEDSSSEPSEIERDFDADYTFGTRRPISYKVLCDRIISLWSPKGKYKVVDLDEENYLVNFSLEEDYLKALLDGPWMVQGQYLIVRPWSPSCYRETQDLTVIVA
ncbi:Uncharacterized protein TCM_032108 [Theobroma cacao]|uniref:DUF4283 domain-containing protein n=1 Tax=Theobroma cacao TaxID=3641 RepID=A0A061F9D2_THECC|nr:Uncharacterized protein TCM_032108 [Theobroma cacao]